MTANIDPVKSTVINTPEIPVVEVSVTTEGVSIKWDERAITILRPDTTLYSDAPYSLSAADANGDAPFIKTFGSLLGCDGGTLNIGGTNYRIHVKTQQTREQQILTQINGADLSCTLLGNEFLIGHNLASYAHAASACVNQPDVIDRLSILQKTASSPIDEKPALFTAIVAPTGTGKTQFAATAAAGNPKGYAVRYLLCEIMNSESAQAFYKPHLETTKLLLQALSQFQSEFSYELYFNTGANEYLTWFLRNGVASPVATLIHRILFPAEAQNSTATMSFGALRAKILAANYKFLMFLDEFPPNTTRQHVDIVLLRDIIRAIGICPIVMSTHSGAQNAILSGRGSSDNDEATKWCELMTRLPAFHATDDCLEKMSPYFCPSERPLVAQYMSEMEKDTSIDEIVKTIKGKLQTKKPRAWLVDPIFQLCQLFRTSPDEKSNMRTTHQLVGEHFGFLVKQGDNDKWCHTLNRLDVIALPFQVQMVVPREEPILFASLLSWSDDSITREGDKPAFFPLVDENGNAISVRAAFERNNDKFRSKVETANPNAIKLVGDHLEVTSLASVVLASMNSSDGVGIGVLLPKFLACVASFMQDTTSLEMSNIIKKKEMISARLTDHKSTRDFSTMRVPCCSNADSPLPDEWNRFHLFRGRLKRPRDCEMRDGLVDFRVKAGEFSDVLQVECKNYFSGVNKQVFAEVVKRLRASCKICILFASSLRNIFAIDNSWSNFITESLSSTNPHEIAFLTLGFGNNSVSWLEVENGRVSLAPTDETQYLFIVIATGHVGAANSSA